jgi:GNAT superfamily N-acetyltransferase
MTTVQIRISPLEQERFGVKAARADNITVPDLAGVDVFCEDNDVEMLIARVSVHHLDAVQQMESDGYRLMDTLVYYEFDYARKDMPELDDTHPIYKIKPEDADRAAFIARQSFERYVGHYHADPRLDDDLCDAVYMDWANRTARDETEHATFGAKNQTDELVSFTAVRMNNPDEAEAVLHAVAPEAQRQGIYSAMIYHNIHWGHQQGAERLIISTQITSTVVQKVWARVGFEFDRAYYTFHKWFD